MAPRAGDLKAADDHYLRGLRCASRGLARRYGAGGGRLRVDHARANGGGGAAFAATRRLDARGRLQPVSSRPKRGGARQGAGGALTATTAARPSSPTPS